jgi:hypothetical protein
LVFGDSSSVNTCFGMIHRMKEDRIPAQFHSLQLRHTRESGYRD